MRRLYGFYEKKLLPLTILLLLILIPLSALNVNITRVSATDYPCIKVIPESTVDPTLTPGKNYTVSIDTDYSGSDIFAYQFTLSYDPDILEGFEVSNGDLIVGGSAKFLAGPFNNTAGELSKTIGLFFTEGEVTSGPGTLANVTFRVVGKGQSDITIGPDTKLKGWDDWEWIDYNIIYAAEQPTHIQHGYFDNRFPHDVAVVSLNAQAETTVGSLVSINVTVANIGKSDEVANVTILYDSTYIDSQNLTLLAGASETVSFSWDTEGVARGTYTINATATIPVDDDPTDNWNTTAILLVEHDVCVVSVTAPTKEVVGSLVSINVTIANIGVHTEVASVTVRHDSTYIDSQNVTLLDGEEKTVSLSWNTTGVAAGNHTLNATATLLESIYNPEGIDDDPTDNWDNTTISLVAHDVSVTRIEAPTTVTPGDTAIINITIENIGSFPEVVNVTVRYGSMLIGFNDTVQLLGGASETVSFSWDTAGLVQGHYTINATATIPEDDDPTDNWKNATILIAMHDVAVQSIMAPTSVYVGELTTIWVLVKNLGWYEETFVVKVTYDTTGIIESPKSVTLLSKDLENIEFSWNTTGVAPGSYKIIAEAILDGDANPTNNRKTRDIPVTVELPPGAIAGTVTDSSNNNPIEGANVTANGYSDITDDNGHYNITDVPVGTYTVTVSAAKYFEQSKTVTLTAGMTKTLDFELALLNGTISGTVKDSSTGNPISEATVTTNGMSATTDSSGTYVISDVPVGTYNVTVSAEGYQSSSKTDITVTAGETTIADFELTPAQPLNLSLYAAVAAVAIVFIAGTAVYIFKIRKPT